MENTNQPNDVVIFTYNKINIPFALDGGPDNIMINITDVVKAYGKKIAEWKRLPSTQEYLQAVMDDMGFSHIEDLIYSERGGANGGNTWVRQIVLIEIARWLDPKFAVWCNKIIIQVLKERFGIEIGKLQNKVNDLIVEINKITFEANNLQNRLNSQQPQINYYNQVLQNPEPLYSTKQIVKQLGIKVSYKKFTQIMIDNGLVYRDNSDGQIYVTANYSKYNYRIATTKLCSDGKFRAVNKWTEAGKQWIYSLAMGLKLI